MVKPKKEEENPVEEKPLGVVSEEKETVTESVKPQVEAQVEAQSENPPAGGEDQPPVKEKAISMADGNPTVEPDEEETETLIEGNPSSTEEETENESASDFEPFGGEEKRGFDKKYLFLGLIIVAVVALIAGGIFVYQKGMKKKEATVEMSTAQPTVAPTEVLEVTPTPKFNREDLKLQVLNGSGSPGAAGEVKDFLEDLGYQDIEVGNAGSYGYEETEVAIKKDKDDYLQLLTDDLAEKYTLSEETPEVDKDSEFDAIITVGKK